MAFSGYIVLVPRWWAVPLLVAMASYFEFIGEEPPEPFVEAIVRGFYVVEFAR